MSWLASVPSATHPTNIFLERLFKPSMVRQGEGGNHSSDPNTTSNPECRSNGPRVGKPEAQNLSRHRGRLRPSKDPKTKGRLWESATAWPTSQSRPNLGDGYDVSRLPVGDSRKADYGESARDFTTLCLPGEGRDRGWPEYGPPLP